MRRTLRDAFTFIYIRQEDLAFLRKLVTTGQQHEAEYDQYEGRLFEYALQPLRVCRLQPLHRFSEQVARWTGLANAGGIGRNQRYGNNQ
jgi:hypothetical protein